MPNGKNILTLLMMKRTQSIKSLSRVTSATALRLVVFFRNKYCLGKVRGGRGGGRCVDSRYVFQLGGGGVLTSERPNAPREFSTRLPLNCPVRMLNSDCLTLRVNRSFGHEGLSYNPSGLQFGFYFSHFYF